MLGKFFLNAKKKTKEKIRVGLIKPEKFNYTYLEKLAAIKGWEGYHINSINNNQGKG